MDMEEKVYLLSCYPLLYSDWSARTLVLIRIVEWKLTHILGKDHDLARRVQDSLGSRSSTVVTNHDQREYWIIIVAVEK
jgi:hypothetical protein